jgi:hypothetical protein
MGRSSSTRALKAISVLVDFSAEHGSSNGGDASGVGKLPVSNN